MRQITAVFFLAATLPISALAKPFTNSLVFFDRLTVTGNTVVVTHKDGVGKLPAGRMDTRKNVVYAKTNFYRVNDFIRLQGGQHNCYWKVIAVSNRSETPLTLAIRQDIHGISIWRYHDYESEELGE